MSARWGLGSRIGTPCGVSTKTLLQRAASAAGDDLWGIAKVLSADPSDDCIAGLCELATNADVDRRRAAIRALGENRAGVRASDVVLAALHDPAHQVVWAAVEAVADLKLIEANEIVVGLAHCGGPLQRTAVAALGEIWQPENFESTLDLFCKSRNEVIRKEAAWVLRRNIDARHWLALFVALSTDRVPRHRVWACEIAAEFGRQPDASRITPLVQDTDGHVRRAAEAAMHVLSA